MSVIRPNLPGPGPIPPQPQRLDEGKLAAQKAFFAAALGQAQAPVQAAAPQPATTAAPAATAATAPARVAAESPAEPPKKLLRPGSLLDIRV